MRSFMAIYRFAAFKLLIGRDVKRMDTTLTQSGQDNSQIRDFREFSCGAKVIEIVPRRK
jgi:hypothetical protein